MRKGFWFASRVVLGIAAAAVFALVFGFLVMYLWNWLMPLILRLPEITYWQAFGIVILAKLLFGAFGGNGRRHDRHGFDRIRERVSEEEGEDWDPDLLMRYRKFWKDEGKEAFESYLRRRGETGKTASDKL